MTEQSAENADAIPAPKAIRVASVIDDRRVVLNVGSNDGVKIGQTYLIYGIGQNVVDPETGEDLGTLELVRGRGKVEHLQPAMCTVRSTMQKKVPGNKKVYRQGKTGLGNFFGNPIHEVEEGERMIELPFDAATVGDYARQI
ncbi:hypothetical protein [Sphingopyxis sp. NFH-91]|uniref:hypothetical protein n=1 Tax=Sphingopyxis sp. NFH-91 TaxID=2744457 RepID=UPI001F1BF7A2|nr:hypothetical protein [Sphingopyxis sp. NFH-91]